MNTSTQAPMNPSDMIGLFSKYRSLITTGTLVSVAVFMAAAFVLPKRYKSSFELSIYSNYFQNPLTRDFTSEILDSAEMRAQREAIIRQSLNADFLDTLGTKYGIYGVRTKGPLQLLLEKLGKGAQLSWTNKEMRTRSEERKELMKRIEVNNLNSNTFQVSFLYSDPDATFSAIQDIYTQITRNVMDVRKNNLSAVHDAIQKRLESLSSKLPSLDSGSRSESANGSAVASRQAANLPLVEEELADVRNQLHVLTTRYTDEHPLVRELREREKSLASLAANSPSASSGVREKPLSVRIPQDAAEEIYRELTKKLNYLNVSLDSDQLHPADYFATLESPLYPASPLFPQKSLFLMYGIAVGLLGSLFIAAIREYFDRMSLRSASLAQQLGIPVLGDMPVVRWGVSFPNTLRAGAPLERIGMRN